MRQRPFLLFLSSLIFLYLPIELIWHAENGQEVLLMDWFLSGLVPIFLLIGLIRVSKVGWYTLVAMVALWGVRDLQSYYLSHGTSTRFLLHLGIYFFSLTYFINPRVRHLYFDPKLRWWRTKRRYETHVPFVMNFGTEWHYPILRNVSEGGCFVETAHPLNLSDIVQITIPLPVPLGVSVIKVRGEVRWFSTRASRSGMGIQFQNPPPEQVKALREFVRRAL